MSQPDTVILVVEDNTGHFRIIEKSLERLGVHIPLVCVDDGQIALDYLLRCGSYAAEPLPRVLLIILDLHLPYVSGTEVLRTLANYPELNRIPRIIMTTSDEPEDVLECKKYGFLRYFVKPPRYDELVEVIRNLQSNPGAVEPSEAFRHAPS